MNNTQLTRYSRHIVLPEIDIAGQEKILQSHVLIIGMGGLGSPLAMYLASSGVGHLTICDDDIVELSNLQRQIIHNTADIKRKKVDSAFDRLTSLNPDITVDRIDHRLEGTLLRDQVHLADIVIDCSDNFITRFRLNEACVLEKKPLVSGSVILYEGQVSVFTNDADSPCYHCLYQDNIATEQDNCNNNGILAPAAGILGCIMASETLKLITGFGESQSARLLRLDTRSLEWKTASITKDPSCKICTPAIHPAIIQAANV